MGDLSEKSQQSVEWKIRAIKAVCEDRFDKETVVEMIVEGFRESYREGVNDTVEILQRTGHLKLAREIAKLSTTP